MNQEKQKATLQKILKKCPEVLTPMKAARWAPVGKNTIYTALKNGEIESYTYSYEDAPCSIHALDFLGSGFGIRFTPTSENTDDMKLLLRKDIAKIVREYETKSKSVCEICGNTGTIRMDLPWKRTLCDKCYFEHINRRKNK